MQKYYMHFRDNKIYIQSDDNDKTVEYSFESYEKYPNIPFYHRILSRGEIITEIKALIKDKLDGGALKQMFSTKRAFMLMPDDVTEGTDLEKRFFDELGKILFGAKEVILAPEFSFVVPLEEKNFICISKTSRMMILTFIKNKERYKQKFIENKDYASEELLSFARELYDDFENFDAAPNIYLNGVHLSQYSDIGRVVDSPELFKNIKAVSELISLKKR